MMQSLDIPLLRSFLAIARTGSISAAAGQVGRTQSALSMQMRRLEDITRQPLLHRTGQGMALTAAGERLLAQAERILAAHDEALDSITGRALSGALSVGCPEDYLTSFFPALLRGFAAAHPAVDIEIHCAPTVELHGLLRRRRVDLALTSVAEGTTGVALLREEPLVWVAADRAPGFLSDPVLPLALSAAETLDHRAARMALDQAGRAYRLAFASASLAGLLAVARAGLAVSVVTRSAVPGDLYVLEDGLPPLPRLGVTLSQASDNPSPLAQAFADYVTRALTASGRPKGVFETR